MEEIWRDIPCFEGIYQASNLGRIKSVRRIAQKLYKGNRIVKEKIMSGTKNEDGYLKVHFKHNNLSKGFFIHRLVALTFIPNPLKKPQVNHIDGNKLNNNISNLEWVTNLENQQHAWKNGLKKGTFANNKKVLQFDLQNNLVNKYISITDASKKSGVHLSNISMCCNLKRKIAGGFIWRFDYGY